MHNVSVIILAAGLSRRMGDRNKLLLPIGGVPMIRHMVNTYRAFTQGPIVVVTGHEAEKVTACLTDCDAQTIFNPDYANGQQTSVTCGLRAVSGDGPILIGLGDQPELTSNDLVDLLAAHRAADPSRISIPMVGHQRGNPIIVPRALQDRLLADPRSPGCKTFTRAHPEHVQFHALTSPGFYADVDTPAAYEALKTHNLEETT